MSVKSYVRTGIRFTILDLSLSLLNEDGRNKWRESWTTFSGTKNEKIVTLAIGIVVLTFAWPLRVVGLMAKVNKVLELKDGKPVLNIKL